MKSLKFLQTTGVAIVGALLMFACTSKVVPAIKLEAPEEGSEVYVGRDLHFVAFLKDSRGLASYAILILPIEGETLVGDAAFNVSYNNTWTLPNEKIIQLHHHEITIPEDAATGKYLFTLSCTNRSKNKAEVSRVITIKNPFD